MGAVVLFASRADSRGVSLKRNTALQVGGFTPERNERDERVLMRRGVVAELPCIFAKAPLT